MQAVNDMSCAGMKIYRGGNEAEMDKSAQALMTSLRDVRNRLSRELNQHRKTIGQQDCENSKKEISKHGGWCRKTSREDGGQHLTDMTLVTALAMLLENKTVGSFGDGPGAYKREILKTGLVPVYDAYDGAPFCEETSEGRVIFMDLTVPQYGIPMYDWVISLEVAEHIPAQFEKIYIDNIVRHAREGIILSWAVPAQKGLSHVNNRPRKYVLNLMKANGFTNDDILSKRLQKSSKLEWLKHNINVFRRSNIAHLDQREQWYT